MHAILGLNHTLTTNLKPKTKQCVFIGYSLNHKGYGCLDPTTGRVFLSRHVVFDEESFPFQSSTSPSPFSSSSITLSQWLFSSLPSSPSSPLSSQTSLSSPPPVSPSPSTRFQFSISPSISILPQDSNFPSPAVVITDATPSLLHLVPLLLFLP